MAATGPYRETEPVSEFCLRFTYIYGLLHPVLGRMNRLTPHNVKKIKRYESQSAFMCNKKPSTAAAFQWILISYLGAFPIAFHVTNASSDSHTHSLLFSWMQFGIRFGSSRQHPSDLFHFLTRRTGNCFICFSPFCFSNLMYLYGSTFLYNMQHIFDEYRKYIFFLPDRHYGAAKVPAGCPLFVNYTASSGIASMLIFHTLQPPVVTTLHKHWEVSYVHFLLLSRLLYLQVNPLSSYFNPIGRRNVFNACVVAKLSVFIPGFLHAVHEKLRTTEIKNNRFSLPYDWGKSRTAFSLYAFVFPIYSLPYYPLYGAFPL